MSTSPTMAPSPSSWIPARPARKLERSAAETDAADLAEGIASRLSYVDASVLGQFDEESQRFLPADLPQGFGGAFPDIDIRVGQESLDGGDRGAILPQAKDPEHRTPRIPGRLGESIVEEGVAPDLSLGQFLDQKIPDGFRGVGEALQKDIEDPGGLEPGNGFQDLETLVLVGKRTELPEDGI